MQIPQPVTTVYTGKRGRPRKYISPELLREAMSAQRRITVSKLARLLKVSRPTLIAHLKKHKVDYKFSQLSNSDLDILVKTYRHVNPASGLRYLAAFLRRYGLRIQKRRVFSSVHRVDGLGRTLRRHTTIQRRQYHVSRPNALWHVDGHHKLILWGIVIHGMVDGYSRTVCIRTSSYQTTIQILAE